MTLRRRIGSIFVVVFGSLGAIAFKPGLFRRHGALLPPATRWGFPRSNADRNSVRRNALDAGLAEPPQAGLRQINTLMTLMNAAVAAQDYMQAAALKTEIDALAGGAAAGAEAPPADWYKLGAAPWLAERLTDLGYRFATPCQSNLLRALTKVVVESGEEVDSSGNTFISESVRLEEEWRDLALRAPTGSGKTLAFLSSLLTTVSRELYSREKAVFDSVVAVDEAREEAEEAAAAAAALANAAAAPGGEEAGGVAEASGEEEGGVAEAASKYDNLALARTMAYALSPALSMAEIGTPIHLWLQQPEACRRKPLALVLCPSRELAAQVGMQLHELLGGNVRQDYSPEDKLSVFNYHGPRGVRLVGLLDESDANDVAGNLGWVDVCVGTPQVAAKLFERDASFFDDLKVLVVDEADLVLEALDSGAIPGGPALAGLLLERDPSKRRHVLVGASLRKPTLAKATQAGILDLWPAPPPDAANGGGSDSSGDSSSGGTLLVTEKRVARLGLDGQEGGESEVEAALTSSESVTPQGQVAMVPSGLKHRVACVEEWRSKGCLVRLMRKDLHEYDQKRRAQKLAGGVAGGRPRVVVFCADDAAAKAVAPSLRNALWGKHKIYALLPAEGSMPLQVLEQFAGAASASLEARSRGIQEEDDDEEAGGGGESRSSKKSSKKSRKSSGNGGEDDDDFDVWGATTAPTVLLTTPVAARGLDFTNLTHVYSLNVVGASALSGALVNFMDEKAEYAHQAGRLGRLGNVCGAGTVTSIVGPHMEDAMRSLIGEVAEPGADVALVPPEAYEVSPTFAGYGGNGDEEEAVGLDYESSSGPGALAKGGAAAAGQVDSDGVKNGERTSQDKEYLEDLYELFDVHGYAGNDSEVTFRKSRRVDGDVAENGGEDEDDGDEDGEGDDGEYEDDGTE
mmetsp:Transcript_23008/g.38896  ORF Transcript_23008/g.38896 Transcript_23008/m.38896 type:complete len:913 (+) Transcript_23008:68-2806(+)